jgi:molybdate transport system substrate-binding protein
VTRPLPGLLITLTAIVIVVSACGSGSRGAVGMVPSSFTGVTSEIDRVQGSETSWIIAGSARLIGQLADGAAADFLVTADRETMQRAVDAGVVDKLLGVIALNRLVLALAPGNPGDIEGVDDLTDPNLLIGVCADEVPCGRLADEAAASLDLSIAADTEEPNVRSLALKISRGELDAGLVYATDALAFSLDTVDDDVLADFVTEYPAATVGADTAEVITFLQSSEGREILVGQGFMLP